MSVKEIGKILVEKCRLEISPLCLYGSDSIPENANPSTKLHFCIANAMISLAMRKDVNIMYYGKKTKRGSCPGAQAWLGYGPWNPFLHFFLSTGIKDISSEFLVASPDLALGKINSVGKVTPLGEYTIIQKCNSVSDDKLNVKAIICFGGAEQIRNLCMLAYFKTDNAFNAVQMPWGSSCSSFITHPAGLAEKSPKDCVILGPMDPTDNYFFPPNILAMGIPIAIAKSMSENIEESFIVKRVDVAYPKERYNPTNEYSEEDFKEFSTRLFGKH